METVSLNQENNINDIIQKSEESNSISMSEINNGYNSGQRNEDSDLCPIDEYVKGQIVSAGLPVTKTLTLTNGGGMSGNMFQNNMFQGNMMQGNMMQGNMYQNNMMGMGQMGQQGGQQVINTKLYLKMKKGERLAEPLIEFNVGRCTVYMDKNQQSNGKEKWKVAIEINKIEDQRKLDIINDDIKDECFKYKGELCPDNGVNIETSRGVNMKSVIWYKKTKEGHLIPNEVPLHVATLDPKKSIIQMVNPVDKSLIKIDYRDLKGYKITAGISVCIPTVWKGSGILHPQSHVRKMVITECEKHGEIDVGDTKYLSKYIQNNDFTNSHMRHLISKFTNKNEERAEEDSSNTVPNTGMSNMSNMSNMSGMNGNGYESNFSIPNPSNMNIPNPANINISLPNTSIPSMNQATGVPNTGIPNTGVPNTGVPNINVNTNNPNVPYGMPSLSGGISTVPNNMYNTVHQDTNMPANMVTNVPNPGNLPYGIPSVNGGATNNMYSTPQHDTKNYLQNQ